MKNNRTKFCLALFTCFGLSFAASLQAGGVREEKDVDHVPTGKGHGEYDSNAPKRVGGDTGAGGLAGKTGTSVPQNGIFYHGGPVMGVGTSSPVNVYYIWYGNWSGNTAPAILEPLASNIGGTPRFNINTTYTNGSGTPIANQVVFKGKVSDSYSQGAALTDAKVAAIVSKAISTTSPTPAGKLPLDPNGVYFVLTSKDVTESSGFCTKYCGWHTAGTLARKVVKYAFVGDPSSQCPSACEAQQTSPNGNPGADGMASVIIHELEEATTDPQLNAWYDASGYENSDKCAWTFGGLTQLSSGAYYNVTVGGLPYLIQQNWVNVAPGYCAMSY